MEFPGTEIQHRLRSCPTAETLFHRIKSKRYCSDGERLRLEKMRHVPAMVPATAFQNTIDGFTMSRVSRKVNDKLYHEAELVERLENLAVEIHVGLPIHELSLSFLPNTVLQHPRSFPRGRLDANFVDLPIFIEPR